MHYHGSLFNRILDAEIASHGASAHALELGAAVRLNGSSDLDWSETVERNRHTGVVFYDYTKDYERAVKSIDTDYHLTYSVSEDPESLDKAIELVRMGGTAAIVTHRNKTKAASFGEHLSKLYDIQVNDGDRHDLRFLDKGAMVTLTAKGSLGKASPFVWTEARL
jgi:D-arabinose 1-dehydrogenase-like Zn-dependent alcohol dehydrogenase